MKYVDISYIIKLHEKLIKSTGGLAGLRDIKQVFRVIGTYYEQ